MIRAFKPRGMKWALPLACYIERCKIHAELLPEISKAKELRQESDIRIDLKKIRCQDKLHWIGLNLQGQVPIAVSCQ
jgi:hypothetical protein